LPVPAIQSSASSGSRAAVTPAASSGAVDLLQRFLDASNDRDLPRAEALLADDLVFLGPIWARCWEGCVGRDNAVNRQVDQWPTFTLLGVQRSAAPESRVVARVEMRVKGQSVSRRVDIWTIDVRDGKIIAQRLDPDIYDPQ